MAFKADMLAFVVLDDCYIEVFTFSNVTLMTIIAKLVILTSVRLIFVI